MKKKAAISVIITVFCIAATVFLWNAVNRSQPEYTEVQAIVLSSESGTRKVLGKRQVYYEVHVLYEGQEYELLNVHSSSAFGEGRTVTVYLSDGKLYANVEGVKTATPLAIVYFIFLFGSFGMVILSATLISKAAKKE